MMVADVLTSPETADATGSGNGGATAGGKSGKKRTTGSTHKRQSAEGEEAGINHQSAHGKPSANKRGSRLNRNSSGLSKDGTIGSGDSKHSTTNGGNSKKSKFRRSSTTSALAAATEVTATSAATAKSSTSKTTTKTKRKPANRSKSFDVSTASMSVATEGTSGSTKKGGKKKPKAAAAAAAAAACSENAAAPPKLRPQQQQVSVEGLQVSSEHDPNPVKNKQQKALLSSMPDLNFQTPKQQVVGDLFVKRRISKQGNKSMNMMPSIGGTPSPKPDTGKKQGKSNTNNKNKRRTSDTKLGIANNKERGRDSSSRPEEGGSHTTDPTKSYFPQRSSSKDPSAPPGSPKRSRSTSKSRRSSSKSSRGKRSISKDKPKLPKRTVSDSSLQRSTHSSSQQQQQPSPLLGADPEDEQPSAESLTASLFQNSSAKGSLATAINSTSTTSRFELSRSSSRMSINRGGDNVMMPPMRERSISNRGESSRTTGNGLEQQQDNNNNKEQSLLGGDKALQSDSDGENEPTKPEESWQVNEKAFDTLSKGKEPRRLRDAVPKKTLKNASVPARKKSDPELDPFVDDESLDSSGDNSKRKSLCGLLPQSKNDITSESSVAGASLPDLLNSSFSSVQSKDESVCTYLSHKKAGLIVAAEVKDGPMKDFLGNLTSAIEKKQASGPPPSTGSQDSFGDDQSINALELSERVDETQAQSKGKAKKAKKVPSLGESLNSSFLQSGVNSLSGSALRFEPDTASLPSLMSFQTKASVAPQLETQHEQDEDEISLPSLMSFKSKGANSVAPAPQRDEDEMSLPSLMSMSHGVKDDASASMPSLASFRASGTGSGFSETGLDTSMADCSLPSLASMPDDPSVASIEMRRGKKNGRVKRNQRGKTGLPLQDIEDNEDDFEEEEVEEQVEDEEPYDEGDYGEPYEESMTELEDESNLDESNLDESNGLEEEEEEEEESCEENEFEEEEDENLYEEKDEEDFVEEDDSGEVEHGTPRHEAAQQNVRASGGARSDRGRRDSAEQEQEPEQAPPSQQAVAQFVVKPKKKKKKAKALKEAKDAKEEQVQMWQAEFQQEQMMQQQQMFWQQQQQLLQQQQMLQQQYWMNNGMSNGMGANQYMMNQYGAMNGANEITDAQGQTLNTSNHVMDPSGASSCDFLGSSSHSERSTGSRYQNGLPKKANLRKSQSLDYDFSFMDNPDMPEVSEVCADDVLQPMNPSMDEDSVNESAPKPPAKGKKKEKDKKVPALSFTSRFKKSVKKIKSGFGVTKTKTGRYDTGLHDKQFFPDLDDDDDEASTMQGLLG